MEVDVEDSPTTSPVKQNGMVVEVAGPVVIQYKDKKNREKVRINDMELWEFELKNLLRKHFPLLSVSRDTSYFCSFSSYHNCLMVEKS